MSSSRRQQPHAQGSDPTERPQHDTGAIVAGARRQHLLRGERGRPEWAERLEGREARHCASAERLEGREARHCASAELLDAGASADGGVSAQRPASRAHLHASINTLAGRQDGAVSREQLVDLGMSVSTIDHRVRSGWLQPVHRGVYRIGPLTTPRTWVFAAMLAMPGSVVSHLTAAGLRRILAWTDGAHVDVTLAGRRVAKRKGIRVHHVSALSADDVEVLDGIRLTSPARTICDLAGVLPERELERALAEALALRILDQTTLERHLAGRPDARGAARLRAMLASGRAPVRTRSEAEERFLALVRRAGVETPAVNSRVAGFEVDFYWRAEGLVVEVDGHAFHSTNRKFESDRRRDSALIAAGIRVIRVTWKRLRAEPERVLADVVRALALAKV
ncbi:MAG TPA: type IV toxin-antitoxin system AbiEi family antitoxin domain-containing protein [Longimicrobiales bacterium]|nr:type IV toxin-antitoxin system AbiEi family antitoxin domain-containing protein [Longimicrobiales bacterium]